MKIVLPKTRDHLSFVFILNTLIGNETKHVMLVDVFVDNGFEYPVILSGMDDTRKIDPFWEIKPDAYVLNSTSTSFGPFMRKIGKSFNYNPHAKFILLQKEEENMNYREELSRYFISTVDVIKHKQFHSEEIFTATSISNKNFSEYSIYDRESIIHDFEDYFKRWKHFGFTICFIDGSVPPYSLYTVCQNCSRNSGLGFDTADMFLQKFNITRLELVVPSYDLSPEKLKNWLTSGMCDMILTPLIIIDDGLLDFIFPINDDELFWFVPSPSKVPKWKYVTRVFSVRIWIIWTLTISVSSLFWFAGRWVISNDSTRFRNTIELRQIIKKLFIFNIEKIIFTAQLFLEQGRASSGKYLFEIAFMVIVILSTLAFNMMYKTRFTSMLLGPDFFEDRINSLEDIVDHELFVSFAEWRSAAFDGTSAKVRNYFRTHNMPCETIAHCVKRMSTNKDLALLMSIENIRYDFENFLDEYGHIVIRPIGSRFLKPLYGSVLLKGNPLVDIMTEFDTRLRDHGFISFILSKYNKRYATVEITEDEQLTIEHLWGAFFILICGIFISLISFLLESLVDFLKKRADIQDSNNF